MDDVDERVDVDGIVEAAPKLRAGCQQEVVKEVTTLFGA